MGTLVTLLLHLTGRDLFRLFCSSHPTFPENAYTSLSSWGIALVLFLIHWKYSKGLSVVNKTDTVPTLNVFYRLVGVRTEGLMYVWWSQKSNPGIQSSSPCPLQRAAALLCVLSQSFGFLIRKTGVIMVSVSLGTWNMSSKYYVLIFALQKKERRVKVFCFYFR